MRRPTMRPHMDCLTHWSEVPCLGCLLGSPYEDAIPLTWRLGQPFRALYYRLFVRFEYPGHDGYGECPCQSVQVEQSFRGTEG